MKINLLLALLFLGKSVCSQSSDVHSIADIKPYPLESIVQSVIEAIKNSLPDGPLNLDVQIPLNFNDTLINGSINIDSPSLIGLKNFSAPVGTVGMTGLILNVNVTLVFPTVELDTNYAADTVLLTILPIYGEGLAKIRLDNLEIAISTGVDILKLQLKGLRIHITLEDVDVNIENLLYDDGFSSFASSLITSLAKSIIVPYLNDNADTISDTISPVVQDLINGLLSSLSSNETMVYSQYISELYRVAHQDKEV